MSERARRSGWGVILFLASLTACDGDAEHVVDSARENERVSDPTPITNLDQLRALGYADVSEEEHDPQETGVQIYERDLSWPGYNLYSNKFGSSAILMDAHGMEVNRWSRPNARGWSNCELMPNGDLIVIGQRKSKPYLGAIDENRYLLRLSWTGETQWKYEMNAHHDFQVLDDGRIAVLSFRRTPDTGQGYGVELREDTVEILGPDGTLQESHSLYDVLNSNPEVVEVAHVAPVRNPRVEYLDLIHANSLEFLRLPAGVEPHEFYSTNHLLVSTRHQDVVLVLDWNTGKAVWSWGRGEIIGPHDATLLENGNVLIFDNGLGRKWSRIVELDPIGKEIVWEYKAADPESFYTASRGSSQRLPNGNTLIAESDRARAFEVTRDGRIVWSWLNPERNDLGKLVSIVRMKRLSLEYVDAILEAKQ